MVMTFLDTQIGILEQKIEMMEKEYQGRSVEIESISIRLFNCTHSCQSLESKLAESEAALIEFRQQYQGAMTSRAVLESQVCMWTIRILYIFSPLLMYLRLNH